MELVAGNNGGGLLTQGDEAAMAGKLTGWGW